MFPHFWLILILSPGYTMACQSFGDNFCGDEDTGNISRKFVVFTANFASTNLW